MAGFAMSEEMVIPKYHYGLQLIENPYMLDTETELFPERCWWRRLYRTHRLDIITWPKRDLWVLSDCVYGHPAVIRHLKEILELGVGQAGLQEVKAYHYPPVGVKSVYIYNWRIVAWLVVMIAMILLVVWNG